MIDVFGYVMFTLVAVLAVGQAARWAQSWHREIDQLQEQARLRAQAAHEQQIEEYRREQSDLWAEFNRGR